MADLLSIALEVFGAEQVKQLRDQDIPLEEIAEQAQRLKDHKIKNNLISFPYTPEFVVQTKNKNGDITGERICAPLLAQYIRDTNHFVFCRDSVMSMPQRYMYVDGCYRLISDDDLKSRIKQYIVSYNRELLKSKDVNEVFFDLTTDDNWTSSRELNADENIINFKNGILHLDTMKLEPHSPRYLSTIQIPCDWTDVDTPTPIYDDFIRTLTDNDESIQLLLEQYMGVVISNIHGYRLKKALFLIGQGDSGKSQLKLLTERLVGEQNCTGLDIKDLESRFGVANLHNKRLAGSADMGFITVNELRTFKKATGGDMLYAEYKGKDGFNFIFNGLLWFCANKKPKFGGDRGDWVYNRMIFVDCNNVIPQDKQDKKLLDKLYTERAGIVQRIVRALKTVIDNNYNLTIPITSENTLKRYKIDNNSVLAFIDECVVPRPVYTHRDNCTTKIMYDIYVAWCKDNNGGYAEGKRTFLSEFAAHFGYDSPKDAISRSSITTHFTDYTLSLDAKRDYAHIYGYDTI